MTSLETTLQQISDWVWGPPLLILLFGTHLFLTFQLRFIQRYLPKAIKLSFSREKEGLATSVVPALTTALFRHHGTGKTGPPPQFRSEGRRGAGCGSQAYSASPPNTPRRCWR
jgi:Na+/alanine symporter